MCNFSFCIFEGLNFVANSAPYSTLIVFILDSAGLFWDSKEERNLSLVYMSSALRSLNQSQEMTFHQPSDIFFSHYFPPTPLAFLAWDAADWCLPWYISLLLFLLFPSCQSIALPWHMTVTQSGLYYGFHLLNFLREMCIPSCKLFTLHLKAFYKFRLWCSSLSFCTAFLTS